ncbi:uncharacterized protein LOC133301336 [Gastrolobium bilobum]|uniref:uncharacterized protein LOC133301336 n=1 Tax=Gastrolobium bilobum TaxID=150636 RepID=UPI002AB31963|nr:uncharacterized protein LOC133301336 [Gastrolobium bilobum]
MMIAEYELIEEFRDLRISVTPFETSYFMTMVEVRNSLMEKDKAAQVFDEGIQMMKEQVFVFTDASHVKYYKIGVGRALGVRKLSPRFIGPYYIIKRVRPVAYQLALPPNLANVHDVFHVSQLRRYIYDDSHIVQHDDIEVKKDLKFVVGPSKVLARDEKQLRNRVIPMIKIQWEGLTPEDATWERKDDILRRYPEFDIRYHPILRTKSF